MKAITAIDVVRFGAGALLKLKPDQVKTRLHNLKRLEDDVFESTGPVEFKRGESFGYDGPLNRAMEEVMEIDGKRPAPKAVAIEQRKPHQPANKKAK